MSAAAWTKSTATRVALGALGVSVIAVGWSLASALRAEPLPVLPPSSVASLETITRGPVSAPTDVEAAVDADIFAADGKWDVGRTDFLDAMHHRARMGKHDEQPRPRSAGCVRLPQPQGLLLRPACDR